MTDIKKNKELLYKLYVDDGLSLSKIASMFSVTSMTIRAWLINNGIKTIPSTQTIYKELKETDFSDSQKSLIIGSVLGDGSLTVGKDCINARFVERHSEKQKEYLLWKRDLLKPFTYSKVTETLSEEHIISGVKCNVQKNYMFSTISHPYLTGVRKIFYPTGKKIVPENLSEYMNALVAAVWFCDDGSFSYIKKSGTYRVDLHTESFSYKENVLICRILSDFFGEGFRINSRKYISGQAFYVCLSGKDEVKKIVDLIKPFIPLCMTYKMKDYII